MKKKSVSCFSLFLSLLQTVLSSNFSNRTTFLVNFQFEPTVSVENERNRVDRPNRSSSNIERVRRTFRSANPQNEKTKRFSEKKNRRFSPTGNLLTKMVEPKKVFVKIFFFFRFDRQIDSFELISFRFFFRNFLFFPSIDFFFRR